MTSELQTLTIGLFSEKYGPKINLKLGEKDRLLSNFNVKTLYKIVFTTPCEFKYKIVATKFQDAKV